MSDAFALRSALDQARLDRDNAEALISDSDAAKQRLLSWLAGGPTEFPHGQNATTLRAFAAGQEEERQAELARATEAFDAARSALDDHLDRERKLFGGRTDDVIALLPVRLETSFAGPRRIRVRVYPDDVHIDSLDTALTEDEREAGRRFWRQGDDKAWQRLLDGIGPRRAAWVAHATREGSTPTVRPADKRRQPRASTLPTAWRFLGISDGRTVVQKVGRPIPTPLPLGLLEPDAGEDGGHAAWLVDFEAAVQVGMATTLSLPEGVGHLDQLFAVGVQDAPRRESTERLFGTLRAHAFTSGMAFLEPGTPTNNTPQSRSDWSSKPRRTLPRRRQPELHDDTDARRLAKAFGFLGGDFLAGLPGGERTVDAPPRAMAMIAWHGLMREFMSDAVSGAELFGQPFFDGDTGVFLPLRRHAVSTVRSRGPMPTVRIGAQPYGVLPVSSPDEWKPEPGSPAEVMLLPWLLRLRNHWRAALVPGWIPRVSDGRPADRTSVEALVRLPTARDLVIRRVRTTDEAIAKLDKRIPPRPGPTLSVGGIPFNSRLRWEMPTELVSNVAWNGPDNPPDYRRLGRRLSDPERDRKVVRESAAFYRDILGLIDRTVPPREFFRRWYGVEAGAVTRTSRTIFDHPKDPDDHSFVLRVLDATGWPGPRESVIVDDLAGAMTLPFTVDAMMELVHRDADERFIERERRHMVPWRDRAGVVLEHLDHLAAVPEGELLPLVFEVLDVLSHRWDAWATSLPTRRIFDMRDAGQGGVRLGGYGWVENLRRDPTPGQRSDGYIHAPSLQHAATAAVLRSGFLGHGGESSLAVDLSSRRVRAARWVLAGVRRGQDLGSLLGYRVERALHDHQRDELIGELRRHFGALSVAPDAAEAGDPTWQRSHEAIAARNVVDGMAMARDPQRVRDVIQAMGRDPGDPALTTVIDELVDVFDAVGDLVLAESVHQLVGGSPLRAGIAADTLGRGEQVPDRFDVVRTPHRGRAITHRVLTVLPPRPGPANGWSRDVLTDLDPALDAWVGHLLGPAGAYRLEGTVRPTDEQEEVASFDVRGGQLGISALGLVLAAAEPEGRLHRALRQQAGVTTGMVHLDGDAGLSSVASSVRSLLGSAQPLRPEQVGGTPDHDGLRRRVRSFATALADDETRRLLGIRGGTGRLTTALDRSPDERDWLPRVAEALTELLGVGVPVAPSIRSGRLPDAHAGVAVGDVTDWVRRFGTVRGAVRSWHDLVTLDAVRRGAAPALSVAQAPRGGDWVGSTLDPTDRPPAREHWVRHTPEGIPEGPIVGYVTDEWVEVLPGSDALAATKRGGDAVPPASELTGLSFHFDRPDAKAPQAILVAVPPDRGRGWTPDTLALVVRDTLELAKLRAVDLADLPLLDDLLPVVRSRRLDAIGNRAFELWRDLS